VVRYAFLVEDLHPYSLPVSRRTQIKCKLSHFRRELQHCAAREHRSCCLVRALIATLVFPVSVIDSAEYHSALIGAPLPSWASLKQWAGCSDPAVRNRSRAAYISIDRKPGLKPASRM
jgi:hypothetical protein